MLRRVERYLTLIWLLTSFTPSTSIAYSTKERKCCRHEEQVLGCITCIKGRPLAEPPGTDAENDAYFFLKTPCRVAAMRRFSARPASVSLLATGLLSPKPTAVSNVPFKPKFWIR